MIVTAIILCEIGFWVLLGAGLVARYGLRQVRLGVILLSLTPVVDLILLAFAAIDIRRGAELRSEHMLAAVYLGVSIAFGHDIIVWADRQVAQRVAGLPARPKVTGAAHAAAERLGWLKHVLAWAIGTTVLALLFLLGGDYSDPQQSFS